MSWNVIAYGFRPSSSARAASCWKTYTSICGDGAARISHTPIVK
jgi:hypothetical protein